jgi:hypothetical protein
MAGVYSRATLGAAEPRQIFEQVGLDGPLWSLPASDQRF